MITIYRNARRIIKNVPDFCGLSSDEKPMDAKNGSTFLEIDTGNTFKFDEEGKNWYEQPQSGGGGSGGTTDYTQLENKPSINGITLEGNQTTEELDIIPVLDLGEVSGELPIQITLNAEQIQTMQKDNCIVTALYSVVNLYLRKIGSSDTRIVFSGIVSSASIYFLVNVSTSQGTFNIFNIPEIPPPNGPEDAGKMPVVNEDGTGWLLGEGGGMGDLELVASATLEEAVDVISLDLSKPCTEVIAVLTPYGDAGNPSGAVAAYLYLMSNPDEGINDVEGISFDALNLKNDGAMVWDFRAAHWRLEGNLIYKASYKEGGYQPDGVMVSGAGPWQVSGNNWEITDIDAFRNLRAQLWNAVFGTGTKLEVYGR